jgi:hypothetical protein
MEIFMLQVLDGVGVILIAIVVFALIMYIATR